jgi:hypothetical protein
LAKLGLRKPRQDLKKCLREGFRNEVKTKGLRGEGTEMRKGKI